MNASDDLAKLSQVLRLARELHGKVDDLRLRDAVHIPAKTLYALEAEASLRTTHGQLEQILAAMPMNFQAAPVVRLQDPDLEYEANAGLELMDIAATQFFTDSYERRRYLGVSSVCGKVHDRLRHAADMIEAVLNKTLSVANSEPRSQPEHVDDQGPNRDIVPPRHFTVPINSLDETDLRILQILRAEGAMTQDDLASRVANANVGKDRAFSERLMRLAKFWLLQSTTGRNAKTSITDIGRNALKSHDLK